MMEYINNLFSSTSDMFDCTTYNQISKEKFKTFLSNIMLNVISIIRISHHWMSSTKKKKSCCDVTSPHDDATPPSSLCCCSGGLLDCTTAPLWTQEPFVTDGYLPQDQSVSYYIRALYIRNYELMNVWTNLIPMFVYIYMLHQYNQEMDLVKSWPLLIIIISSIICMLFSGFAHMFHSKSETWHRNCFLLDYFGIMIYACCSTMADWFASSTLYHYNIMKSTNLPILMSIGNTGFLCMASTKMDIPLLRTPLIQRFIKVGASTIGYIYGMIPVFYRNPMKQMNTCRQMDEDGSELPEFCRQLWSGGESPNSGGGGVDNSHFYSLGANSLSMFGIFGTLIEVCVILFIFVGSLVGLYNLPGFRQLLPQTDNTSITIIIINCLILQLLACSLPVLSRVLGITDFELQGNFGKLDWLGNFPSIFLFNLIFAIETCLCLANKFTNKMQRELYKALRINKWVLSRVFTRNKNSKNPRIASSSSKPPNCDDDDDDGDVTTTSQYEDPSNNHHDDDDDDVRDMEEGCSIAPSDGSGGSCSPTSSSLTLISALSPFHVFGNHVPTTSPVVVARH